MWLLSGLLGIDCIKFECPLAMRQWKSHLWRPCSSGSHARIFCEALCASSNSRSQTVKIKVRNRAQESPSRLLPVMRSPGTAWLVYDLFRWLCLIITFDLCPSSDTGGGLRVQDVYLLKMVRWQWKEQLPDLQVPLSPAAATIE